MSNRNRKLPPVHPGEILREDLMGPLDLNVPALARDLKIPASRLRDIIKGRRAISTDTALRLGRYFGSTAQFWMNLQATYDLEKAMTSTIAKIKRDVQPRKAA